MRLLKIFTICALIQTVLLAGSVQAQDAAAFLPQTISPSVYMNNKDLQNAFILKLGNNLLFDALQENGWSIIATAEALGTYPSKIKRMTSPEQVAKKKGEYHHVSRELIKNKWSIKKTKASLGIGRKKIINIIGQRVVEQGRKKQRQKEIDLEKEMIICALGAYRWNVARASQETGIWKKRIRELIPVDLIQRNRAVAEEQLKQLIIIVLKENQWTVTRALKDRRLVDQEIGKYIVYSMLTVEWIEAKRNAYIHKIESTQKEEIITAIKMFKNSRNCLEEVGNFLGLARGTLNDRLRKHNITIADIKYSRKDVLPVLIEARGNLRQTAQILELNRQVISRRFAKELHNIKDISSQTVWMLDRFKIFYDCIEGIKNKIPSIGYRYKDEDEFFYTATKFKIYRCLQIIKKMETRANSRGYSVEVLQRIAVYKKFFKKIDSILDYRDKSLKTLFALLEIIKIEIGSIDDQRSSFYSADHRALRLGNSLLETAKSEIFINNAI